MNPVLAISCHKQRRYFSGLQLSRRRRRPPQLAAEAAVTWLGGSRCGGCVPRQQVHQQLSLPAPGRVVVGHQVGVGVGEDVGEGAARPCYHPISVPCPGPGHGTHAVLAFTPPQAFIGTKPISHWGRPRGWVTHQTVEANWMFSLAHSCRPAVRRSVLTLCTDKLSQLGQAEAITAKTMAAVCAILPSLTYGRGASTWHCCKGSIYLK